MWLMKTTGKIFLGLALFFLLIQTMSAEELNQSLNYSGVPSITTSPVQTSVSFTDTGSISSGTSSVTFTTDPVTKRKYVTNHVIVRFKPQNNNGPSISNDKIRLVHAKVGAKVMKDFSPKGVSGLQVVQLANGKDVQSAIKEYQSDPNVLYAEPDYVISISPDQTGPIVDDTNPQKILSIPNDEFFSDQWSFNNTGQLGGPPGADIDAPGAWGISTGSDRVIVAVIDTGVLYTHSDLSSNIWKNTGEIPGNGIDDDHNGYVDDIRGWNFVNNSSDPIDDNSHGTHVSGTIGAVGNNTIGVAGVNWQVKIMPLKAFGYMGDAETSDIIKSIEYANANGASVISNSWGDVRFSQGLKDAIDASPAVVVCAAGNSPELPEPNNDIVPVYPASYDSVNIISVAATDAIDQLASFSHYGQMSVDLGAPGTNILSTYSDGYYGYNMGTSMATPHVSGVAALVKAVNPHLTNVQIKDIILNNIDYNSSLSGKVNTSGRLNAYKAVLAAQRMAGAQKIGTYNPSLSIWYLDYNGDGIWEPGTDKAYSWGAPGYRPVTGDWNGDDRVEIGTYNPDLSIWYLDYNGNGIWEPGTDKAYNWGAPGYAPVLGKWG